MRRDAVWHLIRTHHHAVVDADNTMFDAHYANLVRSNSWINREFKESTFFCSIPFLFCILFTRSLTLTEPFKPGRKKLTNKELESQRQVHANTQRELKALVERGRMAITTLRERELLARTSRQIAAEEERAAANKAADKQKHARQAREQKRLQMVLV
jgi:hypothetical protein